MTGKERYRWIVNKTPGSATKRGSITAAAMSLGDCAAVLGISRQAAHQLEKVALHKLRLGLIGAVREVNPELAASLEAR